MSDNPLDKESDESFRAIGLVNTFLLDHSPVFKNLVEIKRRGWKSEEGDKHFRKQRERADTADGTGQTFFFKMMQEIGSELDMETSAFPIQEKPRILDLCMAPGGFSAAVLRKTPGATISGISLPMDRGGHRLALHTGSSARVSCAFLDITMLINEFTTEAAPEDHCYKADLIQEAPDLGTSFDLVFCDGQVLRTQERNEERERVAPLRLSVAQRILGLQRIATGGTFVMLLHRSHAWHSVELLHQFSQFADIQLFKPRKRHTYRGSFYLVAKNVQASSPAAQQCLQEWRSIWYQTTFCDTKAMREPRPTEGEVQAVLDDFGHRLISLATPIWEIQANALARQSFTQKK